MTATVTDTIVTDDQVVEKIKADLAEIGERVTSGVHLADLIREGSGHTEQVAGWGTGEQACALSAAALAARARSLI